MSLKSTYTLQCSQQDMFLYCAKHLIPGAISIFSIAFSHLRSDPVRPFISGHVANSMAAEVIALLHSLLTAPESNTAQIWTTTAEKVGTQFNIQNSLF